MNAAGNMKSKIAEAVSAMSTEFATSPENLWRILKNQATLDAV
jgi:hypothetical protein